MGGIIQISDVWWFDKVVTGTCAVVDHRQFRLPGSYESRCLAITKGP